MSNKTVYPFTPAGVQPNTGLFSNAAKDALIQLLSKVAYIDTHGQEYLTILHAELNDIPIDRIEAEFTQSTWVCYDIYSLDTLKSRLVVTAHYADGSSSEISTYSLSGTLSAGTSTITVTAQEKTDTFTVTVIGTTKLYIDGDECTSVTGGWNTIGFNLSGGTPTVSKNSDHMLIKFNSVPSSSPYSAARSFSTTNKINLSGFTTIIVEMEGYNVSGTGTFWSYYPSVIADADTQSDAYGSDYSSNRTAIQVYSSYDGRGKIKYNAKSIFTTNTSAYISMNLNLYSDTGGNKYTAGAYVKIYKIALAAE